MDASKDPLIEIRRVLRKHFDRATLDQIIEDLQDVPGDKTFRSVVGSTSGRLSSLVFLDFDQLLRLGEQTGLNDSRAYQAVREDLRQVRAVGARSAGRGGDTTAEIRFRLR